MAYSVLSTATSPPKLLRMLFLVTHRNTLWEQRYAPYELNSVTHEDRVLQPALHGHLQPCAYRYSGRRSV
ncbi:hypothetical protein CERSUDRAFT_89750, partial [Gelatoporia subvermispora B]